MSLNLNAKEMEKLQVMLNNAENKQGVVDSYKPEHVVFACTCQGNCDGRTSGCAWPRLLAF